MALLRNNTHIVPTLVIDLSFEDDMHKSFTVHVNDIIRVRYNLNGIPTVVEGKVITISSATMQYSYSVDGVANYNTSYQTNKNGPYIMIDASEGFASNTACIHVCDILDADMVMEWAANKQVLTVNNDTEKGIKSVNAIRSNNGVLEFTTDNGIHWTAVTATQETPTEDKP